MRATLRYNFASATARGDKRWRSNAARVRTAGSSSSSTRRRFSTATRSAIRMCASSASGCLRNTTADAGNGRGRRFPVLWDMVGFTGSGLAHVNWKPFSDNVPERAARLIHERKMGPAIIVFPDCFTALGGNQYVNSSAIGNYADYLTRELIPFVDREFRTLGQPRPPRLLRQVVRRLRRDHPRHEIRAALGSDRRSFGRFVFRFRLLARLAEYAERPGAIPAGQAQARALRRAARRHAARRLADGCDDGRDQALPRARLGNREAVDRRRPHDHESVHGRHLRSRSESPARIPPAVQPGDRGADREALEELARPRPDQPGREVQGRPQVARAASTSIAAGATSITSTMARGSCRRGSPRPAWRTPTRNTTTIIPTSTTG